MEYSESRHPSWSDQLFGENFWDGFPIGFVVDCGGPVGLGAEGRFGFKVGGSDNG